MTVEEKPARKKSSNKRRRTITLRCRALPAEAVQITKLAEDLGMSVSAVLLQAALETKIRRPRKKLPSPDRKALAQLTGQLGKVGSNLNQIARHANREQRLNASNDLSTAIDDCRRLINQLAKLLA
ncbi:MAG: plasmid mobilization relaxosome protein MobC [Proteobacteria bacterium]|nr:plasmid mobilization relaxosome protein MobC [Pseudomonadota bacterium]